MLSSQIKALLSKHSPVIQNNQEDLFLTHPDGTPYQIYTHANLSATQAGYPPMVAYFDLVAKLISVQTFDAFARQFNIDAAQSMKDYFADKAVHVQPVVPGLIFKHHKGNHYELLCVSDGDCPIAVYRDRATQEVYGRDFPTFLEKFEPGFDIAKLG